jgi:hypothetical protein
MMAIPSTASAAVWSSSSASGRGVTRRLAIISRVWFS